MSHSPVSIEGARRELEPMNTSGEVAGQSPAGDSIPNRYEQLIAKLAQAEEEISRADGVGRTACLEEASAIVFDLLYSLDFKHGGEMVPRLAALYGYVAKELLAVGKTGDRDSLSKLRDIIATLKHSWYESSSAA